MKNRNFLMTEESTLPMHGMGTFGMYENVRVLVDLKTGVNYLQTTVYYANEKTVSVSVTPRLNENGKPVVSSVDAVKAYVMEHLDWVEADDRKTLLQNFTGDRALLEAILDESQKTESASKE